MRAVGTVVGAAALSASISGALIVAEVSLKLGIVLGPHQQFEVILLIVVQVIVAFGAAVSPLEASSGLTSAVNDQSQQKGSAPLPYRLGAKFNQ